MNIDVHAHFTPEGCLNMVDGNGHKLGPTTIVDSSGRECITAEGIFLGYVSRLCDAKVRLREMDKIGLDMAVISVPPTNFFYYADTDFGLNVSQKQNDSIAELVRAYPDRFVGMATVPMQSVANAVAELERAITKLGLKAVEINTNINGKNLDEPEFMPFFEKVQALDIPVFLHPHYVIGAERLCKHFLVNLIGNPVDTAIAIASLIFGGIMERFPGLKLIAAHAGGVAPFIQGRWDHGYKNVSGTKFDITIPPSDYLKKIYLDTITHYKPALMYLIKDHGIDHVVMGSDYPFEMADFDPVNTVKSIGLSSKEQDKIMWKNAATLLKL